MNVPVSNPSQVPNHQPHDFKQRLLELFTGLLPFIFLALVFVLSRYSIELAAVLILIYILAWLLRLFGYNHRLIYSFYYLKLSSCINWEARLKTLRSPSQSTPEVNNFWQDRAEKWYNRMLKSGVPMDSRLDPDEIYQAIIVAVYNEPAKIIETTVQAIDKSKYDHKKIILLIAYEERGGALVESAAKNIAKKYSSHFMLSNAIKHPDNLPGEAKAKAGNITYAAKYLSNYCKEHKIASEHVLVTTLDSDNQPNSQYLASLAWTYSITDNRTSRSYQPLPLFTNNIWDVPAIVRVIATDSSFWFMIGAMQPKRLRLFSAYAQSLQTLEEVDYWNVEVVVEDGHQYWRTYFNLHGDHFALPIWAPVYQDAVQSTGYLKTLLAQFRQLLRWSWGTADTPWMLRQAWRDKQISWSNKIIHILRQIDDYIAWSTAPIVLAIGGWLPLLLSPHAHSSSIALHLPYVTSALQLLALIGLIGPVSASLLSLPPRPSRYGKSKNIVMVLQWALEPLALIGFISFASLNAHLRLIINKPLETFHATIKTRHD